MSEHLTPQQIRSYKNRQISAEELRRVDAHLATCTECAHALVSARQEERALAAWRALVNPTPPLSYDQLETYIENRLSPDARAEIDARLQTDPRAQADLDNLYAAQALVTTEPVRLPSTSGLSPTPGGAISAEGGWGWKSIPLSLGGAFAAGLLVWAVGMRPLVQRNAALQGEVQQKRRNEAQQQAAIERARTEGAQQAQAALQQTTQQLAQAQTQQQALIKHQNALDLTFRQQQQASAAARQKNAQLAQSNQMLRQDLNRLRVAGASGPSVAIAASHSELTAIVSAFAHDTLPIHINTNLSGYPTVAARGSENPITPAGTTILSDRPIFHWNPLPGAVSYQVFVTDRHEKPIAQTETAITATEWLLPMPLTRGEVYYWQVQPLDRQGKPLPNPIFSKLYFQVLAQKELGRYLDAEIKLAILQAHDGLYDSAEALLQEAAHADQTDPLCAQAAKLLRDIQQQRAKAAK